MDDEKDLEELSEEDVLRKIEDLKKVGIDLQAEIDSMSDDEIEVLASSEEEEDDDDDDDDDSDEEDIFSDYSNSSDEVKNFDSNREQNYDDLFSDF